MTTRQFYVPGISAGKSQAYILQLQQQVILAQDRIGELQVENATLKGAKIELLNDLAVSNCRITRLEQDLEYLKAQREQHRLSEEARSKHIHDLEHKLAGIADLERKLADSTYRLDNQYDLIQDLKARNDRQATTIRNLKDSRDRLSREYGERAKECELLDKLKSDLLDAHSPDELIPVKQLVEGLEQAKHWVETGVYP